MPPKQDINKAGFEQSEFPILCETCLGPNPYVRMTKQDYGAECKICTRPFTLFRWQPGSAARFKKTEVCQTCARVKNVCQTCLLDLQFNLPTQVRDAALQRPNAAPTSNVNREYFAQNMEGKLDEINAEINFGKADSAGKELLKKLARADPYYHRNKPKLCSFFAKGACDRGDACPYRHEMPKERNEMSHQTIEDRYHGRNDPVARRILATAASDAGLAPPEDPSVTSLFLTRLPDQCTEPQLRAALPKMNPSALKSVVVVEASHCAFLNFSSREAAEEGSTLIVASGNGPLLMVENKEVKVQWGRSKPKKTGAPPALDSAPAAPITA